MLTYPEYSQYCKTQCTHLPYSVELYYIYVCIYNITQPNIDVYRHEAQAQPNYTAVRQRRLTSEARTLKQVLNIP